MPGNNDPGDYPSPAAFNIADHLPLRLIKSDIIPPAPNRTAPDSEPAVDWLHDFAGYAWVAYGAASLLVVSHFPDPSSDSEPLIGPILRQVFELGDCSSFVSAVSWSPAAPSSGDLAAASGNCIELFSCKSETARNSNSCFCWSQNATLVQSTNVKVIKWTPSGDGIIAGGIEVVLWKRREKSWERVWKFEPEVPHTLISAACSIDGPLATAHRGTLQSRNLPLPIREPYKCVLVSYGHGDSKSIQVELRHPSPVSMMQWRPSTGRSRSKDARHPRRLVLLTSCLDGTVRLWSENDDGRVKKTGRDSNDHKMARCSFIVVAVVEVNQALNGALGSNVYVSWAGEVEGFSNSVNDYECDKTGSCEWLVGVGPQSTVTFWAVHCLDDFSPQRFPRVTLWKRRELNSQGVEGGGLLLNKVFIGRNRMFSSPTDCSLVELLSCNSLAWLQLHSKQSPNAPERSSFDLHREDLLSSHLLGMLDIDSHAGNILKVVVHPYLLEGGLAASLDANGVILFWSLTTSSNSIAGLPTLKPSCKLSDRNNISESDVRYTSLGWTPAVLNEDRILVMGHASGIDCYIVKVLGNGRESSAYNYLCTIPFGSQDFNQGPTTLCAIPLPSTCQRTFVCNNFMLFAIWKGNFRSLSWKLTLHHHLPGSSIDCPCDIKSTVKDNMWSAFESEFSGMRYCIYSYPFSSIFPAPYDKDVVSSFSVVQPSHIFSSRGQDFHSADELGYGTSPYHIVTGCDDGTVKLWRSVPANISSSYALWSLVGELAAHQGPVLAVSPSLYGGKLATVSSSVDCSTSNLHIWETMLLGNEGLFVLEDTISLGSEVLTVKWLTLGNGLSLLGMCLPNEVKIYAQKRCGGDNLKMDLSEGNIWVCIAVTHTNPVIHDFFWGPNATVGVVHLKYFCLYTHLSHSDYEDSQMCCPKNCKDVPSASNVDSVGNLLPGVFFDSDIQDGKESSVKGCARHFQSRLSINSKAIDGTTLPVNAKSSTLGFDFDAGFGFLSFSGVAEMLGGPLPCYHPEVLLLNICAGNWMRAYVALQHLVDNLGSAKTFGKAYCVRKETQVIPQIPLANYLDGFLPSSLDEKSFQWAASADEISSSSQFQKGAFAFDSSWASGGTDTGSDSSKIRSEPRDFVDVLDKLYDSARIGNLEKLQIRAIIDILQELSSTCTVSAYGSLDDCGRRFWVAMQFRRLYFTKRYGRSPLGGEAVVPSELIGWAFHSDCQENLFDSLLSKEPSWQEMHDNGVGFWYSNASLLRMKMEKLARQRYLKTRDPKDCALLYIALNRIQVLAGLFKISKNEKDKPLVTFLSRNFQEENNKAAALKNAYVLMGKHQLELAAAFFLLGGDAYSAVSVCAKNLGDEQLALVICRLVDGYAGPLESNLISKVILPSSILRGDYWLASLLEWILGNYLNAYLRMLGFEMNLTNNESTISTRQKGFLDPSIGHYCLMLANKTNIKNAVGESRAAVFSRWAILMSAIALGRSGLPIEALECLSSTLNASGAASQGVVLDTGNVEFLKEVLKLSHHGKSSNWISGDLTKHKELHTKSEYAMNYLSEMLKEHPSWRYINIVLFGNIAHLEPENEEYKSSIDKFINKLIATLLHFQQKFMLDAFKLIDQIVLFLCLNGLHFIGYHVLVTCASRFISSAEDDRCGSLLSHSILPRLQFIDFGEVSIISKYVVTCVSSSRCLTSFPMKNITASGSVAWKLYGCNLIRTLWCLRASLMLFCGSFAQDYLHIPLRVLDVAEYLVYFASAWDQINIKGLALIAKPLLLRFLQGYAPQDIIKDLKDILSEIRKVVTDDILFNNMQLNVVDEKMQHEQVGGILARIPEEERWLVICYSLWGQVSSSFKPLLSFLTEKLEESVSITPSGEPMTVSLSLYGSDSKPTLPGALLSFAKLQYATCMHVSVYCAKQLTSYLLLKGDVGIRASLLRSDDDHNDPISPGGYVCQRLGKNVLKSDSDLGTSEIFWHICSDPKIVPGFIDQNVKLFECLKYKSLGGWNDVCTSILREFEGGENSQEEQTGSETKGAGSPMACLTPNDHPFLSSGGDNMKRVLPFNPPTEIYRRPGELLEAMCINSIDHHQAALATNKKGIIYFNWEDGLPGRDGSEYIWAKADWPQNGWAGSESTPVPTCVSPGFGLGSRKGVHLGLGGATIGAGISMRPAREQMNSGVTRNLGWGIQEYFEQFIDPIPTIESVRTSSFSTHPSMPLFLVGSSNTHVYLWEFGKDRGTATYGVLPAANVPPPYALASISSVRFDQCGHRFVSGALDGTVCTWQLEVGGRSNVGPTESSTCFDNYTSDVTYITPSGSVIAAAGYSSNGINVIIWDTLAPVTTSRATIMCHEGGTRSLSVFDNNIGSGSVSPFIVTGGKAGDVGLHDFRYIATGRTKKHKHTETSEANGNMSSSVDTLSRSGDQNRNGMLWYIPKAHTGSVTKVSTIPNTSLFLTGSKDGDVKLWDAKKARLVFHWPRLHERHTFLGSRGFGGIVREGVTDIQVYSHGFLTCGGDGTVKLVRHKVFTDF